MDVFQFKLAEDSEHGAECQLRHPKTGEPIPVWITVIGPDSKAARKAQTDILRAAQRNEDDIDVRAAKYMAAVTKGWRNIAEGDKDLVFSNDEAIRVYTNQVWIREQVEVFQAQRINFPGASSPSSKKR